MFEKHVFSNYIFGIQYSGCTRLTADPFLLLMTEQMFNLILCIPLKM